MNLRIKELRTVKKMSRAEFAAQFGMDNSQYGKIENGKLSPTLALVMEICSKFDVSSEWLLFGQGEMLRNQIREKNHSLDAKSVDNNILLERLEKLVIENHELKQAIEQLKNTGGDKSHNRSYPVNKEKVDISTELKKR